jgi:hypothetical protein
VSAELKRIAEILYVDEVVLQHGPKGVAVHVRSDKVWHSVAIDNADLVKSRGHDDARTPAQRRLEVIAEHLAHLADANIGKVRDLRKSVADAATRAAVRAEQETSRARRAMSWDNVPYDRPYDGPIQQQVTRPEYEPPSTPEPAAPSGPAAETMPSRFHAIMAELRCL